MSHRHAIGAALVAVLLALVALVLFTTTPPPAAAPGEAPADQAHRVDAAHAGTETGVAEAGGSGAADRAAVAAADSSTGVRGIVVDANTGLPLAGIEVLALAQQPSFEPLINRFRGLFQGGMFTDNHRPPQILARTTSAADGTFELRGMRSGLVFLDGRSDGHYVRTPATARLAQGEMREGVELRASPAGRVRGIVLGPDGGPVAGAPVSLRPGLNAFLGQITERKYRWLETATDADGRFDLPGVPTGNGYVVSAASPSMALEEQFGLEVREGQVTEVTLRGHEGATIAGRVTDAAGAPVAGANVAMVYLDLSRVLFSADGRSEPITTDAEGRFTLRPVAAGRVAFVAAADGLAPSTVEELAVVDGGVYGELELRLGDGVAVSGIVVDDRREPVVDAVVELRPFERPDDPQFLKMMLKIRRVEVRTGADGRFTATGMTGERLVVQASKPGYTTAIRTGVRLDDPAIEIQIQRGVVVRGRVQTKEGEPVARFSVDTRSRTPRNRGAAGNAGGNGAPATGDAAPADAGADNEVDGASGATDDGERRGGFQMRMGGGRGDRGGRGGRGGMRETTMQLPEGQTMGGMNMDGNWREIAAADGRFELRGVPPGSIRVRVRVPGCLDPESQTVELAATQTSDELVFSVEAGLAVHGTVVDGATRKPVGDAQVTAYLQRDRGRRGGMGGMFQMDMDPEDMDFLALSATQGRRSAITDSKGRFTIESLSAGKYRFTARHPDMAKASAKDVDVQPGAPIADVEILLDAGGSIEGNATGQMDRPLADAVIAAFSMQSGTLRSASTDKAGYYRIDGLPPGQYAVFKSRMDERADNIPLELLSNMRLKTATVKEGKTVRLDIHDESEDGVRVHGVVREAGAPVPRALVTLLGTDREGFLGMGVRANAAGADGRYELIGIKPGSYVAQVSRFQGRPMQTSFTLDVPEGQSDFTFDIDLPTSEVAGRVVDTRGMPVAGVQVSLGSDDAGLAGAEGLVGMIAQGGLSQARTDENGEFRMRSVAPGTYRLRAGSRMGRGFGGGGGRGGRGGRGGANSGTEGAAGADAVEHGEATLEGVVVDGMTVVEGLVINLPIAARITGIVVDGSGAPVVNAEIHYAETSAAQRREKSNPLASLFGMQARPITSGADGRFEITGLNPGVYDLRVDTEALEAGRLTDVQVAEAATVDVTLRIVRGATLRVRATNVDKKQIPLAWVSLLDGQGKSVVSNVSTFSVMRRLMANRDRVEDSGWYEFGSVPPDTYTIVVAEPSQEELRITRTITDGERVEWDIDVAAELASRAKK